MKIIHIITECGIQEAFAGSAPSLVVNNAEGARVVKAVCYTNLRQL